MVETLKTVLGMMLLLFRSRSRLQVEILVLRQQLIVLRRTAPKRARLRPVDRLLFLLLYRLWPGVLDSVAVIQLEHDPLLMNESRRVGCRSITWRNSIRSSGRRPSMGSSHSLL